jgi:hypothetical protein
MVATFILVIIVVAVVSAVLHVSAGWAWIIVIVGVVGLFIYRSKNPLPYRRISKMGTLFSSVCPFCGKHTKSAAVVCNHCGRSLVVRNEGTAPAAAPKPPTVVTTVKSSAAEMVAARLATLDDLKNRDLISAEEYADRRAQVLAEV